MFEEVAEVGGVFEAEFFCGPFHFDFVFTDAGVDVGGAEVPFTGWLFGGAWGGEDVTEGEREVFGGSFLDGCGGDVVSGVVGLLDGAALVRDLEGVFDGGGLAVGIHDDAPLRITCGSATGLDE